MKFARVYETVTVVSFMAFIVGVMVGHSPLVITGLIVGLVSVALELMVC